MNRTISARLKWLLLLLLISVGIMCTNGWILARNIQELVHQQDWVEQTHVTISELEGLLSSIGQAEISQRGFLLTKDERSVYFYNETSVEAWSHLAKIKSSVRDAKAREEIEILDRLIAEHFQRLNTYIDLNKQGKLINPAEAVRDSRVSLGALRRQTRVVEDYMYGLLAARSDEVNHRSNVVSLTLGLATILNLALAFSTYFLFRRSLLKQASESRVKEHDAWLKIGEAEAATIASGDKSIESLGQDISRFVADACGVPAVILYLEMDGAYHRISSAGPPADRDQMAQTFGFKAGEGLVGRAAAFGRFLEVNEVPDGFFLIGSGAGAAKPRHLLYIPIRFQERTIGVIELAVFEKVSSERIEWLERIASVLGAGLSSALNRKRLSSLLQETQSQSEELQAQQEELRTSNEELEQQTRALLYTQERMQAQQEELRQINEELEQQTKTLESQQSALQARTSDLERSRKLLEDKAIELEKASQYKSEFLAKMSHELRTPLNSLMILATLLQENKKGNLDEQQVEFAHTILASSSDLLNIINDILDLSKLEARKLEARPEPFSLRAFFEQMVQSFKPLVDTKDLQLSHHIGDGVPDGVVSDQMRLQQVIRNLLANAVKFTERGQIMLSAEVSPISQKFIRILVSDTGIGIPETKKRMIFEAFEQADSSVSRKYGGTGLGLTISRELVHLLGGQISVESEEGKGSRFMIDIPTDLGGKVEKVRSATSHAATSVAEVLPKAIPARAGEAVSRLLKSTVNDELESKTLLIVEDDDKFRASVAKIARSYGFQPIEASSSEVALDILKYQTPRAVLLDVKLPGMSGISLLEKIKGTPHLRHIPIHMMSGLEEAQNALRLGAVGYLGKPATLEAMRAAFAKIEHVLAKEMKRVLVIEDDTSQRNAISQLVGGKNTEILAVGSGQRALDVMSTTQFDCVILDLSLPDMSGFELLEHIGRQHSESHPPIVIYTGKELSAEEEERLRRYSDSIIIKGAKSPDRLLDEVNLFLHRIETELPQQKRELIEQIRDHSKSFAGRSVLLVDDDLRNVFALTSALEGQGFDVIVARNGLEALERLESAKKIDVVLMDIMMPKMDGHEAMRRIREKPSFKNLPIIALTAKTMKGEYEKCVQAGANDYLPKPINLKDLLSVLRVWLPQAELNA